jgi:hypothetical protein
MSIRRLRARLDRLQRATSDKTSAPINYYVAERERRGALVLRQIMNETLTPDEEAELSALNEYLQTYEREEEERAKERAKHYNHDNSSMMRSVEAWRAAAEAARAEDERRRLARRARTAT